MIRFDSKYLLDSILSHILTRFDSIPIFLEPLLLVPILVLEVVVLEVVVLELWGALGSFWLSFGAPLAFRGVPWGIFWNITKIGHHFPSKWAASPQPPHRITTLGIGILPRQPRQPSEMVLSSVPQSLHSTRAMG